MSCSTYREVALYVRTALLRLMRDKGEGEWNVLVARAPFLCVRARKGWQATVAVPGLACELERDPRTGVKPPSKALGFSVVVYKCFTDTVPVTGRLEMQLQLEAQGRNEAGSTAAATSSTARVSSGGDASADSSDTSVRRLRDSQQAEPTSTTFAASSAGGGGAAAEPSPASSVASSRAQALAPASLLPSSPAAPIPLAAPLAPLVEASSLSASAQAYALRVLGGAQRRAATAAGVGGLNAGCELEFARAVKEGLTAVRDGNGSSYCPFTHSGYCRAGVRVHMARGAD
jgi:hypothetical protein